MNTKEPIFTGWRDAASFWGFTILALGTWALLACITYAIVGKFFIGDVQ